MALFTIDIAAAQIQHPEYEFVNQGCSVLSFISQSADVADATEGVGVAVLAD